MAKNTDNVHVYSDADYAVWTAVAGTATPTTLPPTSPGAAFYELGLLSANGLTEGHSLNESKIYDMAGSLIRVARNQEERPWTFECLEDNAVTAGLRYPGSTVTTSGATVEVVLVTVTATGGTFVLEGGIGGSGVTEAIAEASTNSIVQAAIRTLPGLSTVTVAGSAGGPFTVTGPASGDSMNLSGDGSLLTGSPALTVAITTPGVVGHNRRDVGPGTSRNLRAWAFDLPDGTVSKRVCIDSGEATQTGTVGYTGSGAAILQFTVQPFKTGGRFYRILDNDPAQTGSFA